MRTYSAAMKAIGNACAASQTWCLDQYSFGQRLEGVELEGAKPMVLAVTQIVESRKGAVAVRHGQWLRFPSPLIKPDVRICRIRLSDWLGDRLTRGRPLGGNGAF